MSPKQGDLIYIDAEPHIGHEEGGHDPAAGNIKQPMVVISNDGYNQQTGMVVCMPITSKQVENRRMYAPIADFDSGIKGSIILFQVPNYDFVGRHGEVVGKISNTVLNRLIDFAKTIY